ncbi:tRNA pseudouridine(38-40) synthase TruA [Pedobacter insulae]|uniref:tRNA pseudouridine synthase A n=1 Tax=Pedobacter insulae TaxID=414048 RepID=A0A1I2VZM8_9SPHI|nr:tRNA pseudouridine(38-40) synthase TruA [Pedobacter insulae]SFG94590.1 tRNA pseudouridine38-40 synthase [Pedobacter insulae]
MNSKRYFIEISYNGTTLHGWQIQPNALTVQECLDKALSIYFRQEVVSLGCGRTDAGVHAIQFYAHFNVENIEEGIVIKAPAGINALLPYAIAVKQIFAVSDDAHARFDATSRAYQYHIHFEKDPFKLDRSWLYKGNLDLFDMNKAAAVLLDFTDFSCFSKSNTQTFTNNCKIKLAYFEMEKDGSLIFHIKADRFLRNMVRAIVGTLILVGKGELGVIDVQKIVGSKNRSKAGQSVPACGLYLVKVEYPYV